MQQQLVLLQQAEAAAAQTLEPRKAANLNLHGQYMATCMHHSLRNTYIYLYMTT